MVKKRKKRIRYKETTRRLGFILIFLSIFMEINFHYIQGYKPENIMNDDLFWRAENSIWPISLTLFVIGFYLISITRRKR